MTLYWLRGYLVSYSRKIYLINPKFQIRFSLYVCILVFLTSIIYPFSIYELMNTIITHFSLKNPEIASHYSEKRDALILVLILLHLGFTCLTFFICVYISEVTSYINNLSLVVPDDKRVVLNEISSRLSLIQERFTKN